jgi:hypothetical protein
MAIKVIKDELSLKKKAFLRKLSKNVFFLMHDFLNGRFQKWEIS